AGRAQRSRADGTPALQPRLRHGDRSRRRDQRFHPAAIRQTPRARTRQGHGGHRPPGFGQSDALPGADRRTAGRARHRRAGRGQRAHRHGGDRPGRPDFQRRHRPRQPDGADYGEAGRGRAEAAQPWQDRGAAALDDHGGRGAGPYRHGQRGEPGSAGRRPQPDRAEADRYRRGPPGDQGCRRPACGAGRAMSNGFRLTLLAAVLSLTGTAAARAETAAPAAAPAPPAVAAAPATAAPASAPATADSPEAAQYCRNIANAASDARYARQALAIKALEKELDDRIARLEAKRAEYEDWIKRRQEFLDKADGAVVAIYSQMRPDAAAQQIAIMDPEAAAAILAKLNPRTASAILNEMPATTAAILTSVMAGLPKGPEGTPG